MPRAHMTDGMDRGLYEELREAAVELREAAQAYYDADGVVREHIARRQILDKLRHAKQRVDAIIRRCELA